MKKIKISVAALLLAGGSLLFSSCIGSFSLTKDVLAWNNKVGSKFINELVFFAFWILPVYEVTSLADILVLNSIEFWSGKNPMETASVKTVETNQGKFIVESDESGYTITHEETGDRTRLDFDKATDTWSVNLDGEDIPFMTFIDENHVKMITPEGDMRVVDISAEGVMAYSKLAASASSNYMAAL